MEPNNNKSPWAKGASVDTTAAPSLDALIDQRFAKKYIAERLPPPYDNMRNLRQRVGKKLQTAVTNGKLKSVNGQYKFGDLATWAKRRTDLAPAFADIIVPNTGTAEIVLSSFTARGFGFSLPSTLPECQAELANAYRELNTVREENTALKATVATLHPYKAKAEARSQAAKKAGQQGGRGNKK